MVFENDGTVVAADPPSSVGGLKKKGGGSRNWVLMDSSGRENMLDVDKYAIMHRVKIHARDLRIIDPLLSYPSTILGREKAIVLNLEHIKAIITSEEVLLRDPLADNIVPIVEDLRRRLIPPKVNSKKEDVDGNLSVQNYVDTEDGSPFEFRALEVALEAICSYLSARTIELESAVYPALDMLTSKISSKNLDRVRKLKSQMTRLTARVQKVKDELEQLLDDDDDMADLYLSRKLAGASPTSGSIAAGYFHGSPTASKIAKLGKAASIATVHAEDHNDVEELEMLLESYFMQIDGTFNKLMTLREYIDNTEDYINIQLDNYRNQLIQLDLFMSAANMSLAVYSLVTAIFGMNIPFSWNEHHGYMFKWVCIVTGVASIIVFIIIISYARHRGLVS